MPSYPSLEKKDRRITSLGRKKRRPYAGRLSTRESRHAGHIIVIYLHYSAAALSIVTPHTPCRVRRKTKTPGHKRNRTNVHRGHISPTRNRWRSCQDRVSPRNLGVVGEKRVLGKSYCAFKDSRLREFVRHAPIAGGEGRTACKSAIPGPHSFCG